MTEEQERTLQSIVRAYSSWANAVVDIDLLKSFIEERNTLRAHLSAAQEELRSQAAFNAAFADKLKELGTVDRLVEGYSASKMELRAAQERIAELEKEVINQRYTIEALQNPEAITCGCKYQRVWGGTKWTHWLVRCKEHRQEAQKLREALELSQAKRAELATILNATRNAILDSIANKLSMNNMKYDSVGKQAIDLLEREQALKREPAQEDK